MRPHPNPSSQLVAFVLAGFALGVAGAAQAENLRIATWNLGWHVASSEVQAWAAQCGKHYVKNPATQVWALASPDAPGAKRGWDITESRATLEGVDLSVMPPCNVYQTAQHQGIAVTPNAHARRNQQLSQILARDVRADVIAFQEVSGTQAVIEALGPAASDFNVCSFDGQYKVQRLAFAWRKTLGGPVEACRDLPAVSLPALPAQDRVRPAYTVVLNLAGKRVRFLTVHLKSGCVTPLDKRPKRLDDPSAEPCVVLQQQVQPLEESLEALGQGVDHFVVLGDFNRNLAHEQRQVKGAEAVRSDGTSDLTRPMPAGVSTRNLFLEVNDGHPTGSKAVLLLPKCPGSPALEAACDASKTGVPTPEQQALLSSKSGLGCRNPVGLDHIIVSQSLASAEVQTRKVAIGALGGSRPASAQHADPLLAVSDHCPLVTELRF